jgi:DNA-binding response OmpR family regulator
MRKLSILLAEDDEMIEKITTFFLKRNGHEVDIDRNGIEAISRFKVKEYDLVLMDIMMPGMDGLQAVKEIRKHEKEYIPYAHTTIIAITTNPDKVQCLKAGIDGYAQKPFNFDELSNLFYEHHLV